MGVKHTAEERRRRRAAVVKLYQKGYSFQKIGAALSISSSTAANDVRELGLGRRGRRPYSAMRDDTPAPIDWRTESGGILDPRAPAYRTSRVTVDVAHWIEGFNGGDYPNRLAWNIHEATALADQQWLDYVRKLLTEAHDQIGRLLRVVRDPIYRETCMRADLGVRTRSGDGPKLRSVT